MAKGQGQKVNRKQLADVFGISLPTVDSWVRAGCPYDLKGASGREWQFDTAAVMRWRERIAKEDASDGAVVDEAAVKLRKLKAEAAKAELDLRERMGEVADIATMERALSRTFAELQSRLRGPLVARCAVQLIGEKDERKFKAVLLGEVDAALEILSKMDPTEEDSDDDDAGAPADG